MVAVREVGVLVVTVVILHVAHADGTPGVWVLPLEAEALAGDCGTGCRARLERLVVQWRRGVVAFGEVPQGVGVTAGGSVAMVGL